ncbi:hypothetical protein DMUE_2387 [Dictyocoela muelleri]|nr:hypothetical protein DMUE_2387 [Dictyocoela muelleri]
MEHTNLPENSNTHIDIKSRKKRQSISTDIIKNIRKGLNRGISVKDIASEENLSLQTTYGLINKISDGKTDEEIVGVKKRRKAQEYPDVKSKIAQILFRDASYTQCELSEELNKWGLYKNQATISRVLKEMGYSRKRLVKIPEERNSIRNIDARQTYSNELEFINDENLVFLDETGINLNQSESI